MYYIKNKKCGASNDNINREKMKTTESEKTFGNSVSDKELISKILKFMEANNKTQLTKGTKDLNCVFQKTTQMSHKHMKRY